MELKSTLYWNKSCTRKKKIRQKIVSANFKFKSAFAITKKNGWLSTTLMSDTKYSEAYDILITIRAVVV